MEVCQILCLSILLSVSSLCLALPDDLYDDIHANKEAVDKIIEHVLNGPAKGQAYSRLATFTDKFGPRVSGSQVLEDSIDYMIANLTAEGFENVDGEDVWAPDWQRGEEWAAIVEPRDQKLDIMSTGSSIGTNGTLTAEVLVVSSFEELDELSETDVAGKIVVYNQGWVDYSHGYVYRNDGAWRAAEKGAVAALLRSVTDYSLYTPHTGQQNYKDGIDKIPVACITVEDAELMARYQKRGETIRLSLYMEAETFPNVTSRNVVAELRGSEHPEETVIIGGHIDSWDVGMGVMDDAGGVVISWQALTILKGLGLTPKRTIRAVLWTAEEQGLIGAKQYYERHKEEADSMSLVMESDAGTFKPHGIGFTGSGLARAILEETMSMLASINTTGVGEDGSSPDTGEWMDIGVPVGNLWNANEDYFYYHHTHADSMTMMDSDVLDRCSIVWAAAAYVVANLEDKLPREGDYPSPGGASVFTPAGILTHVLMAVTSVVLTK